ncbi:MAG: hypothetical protein HY902_01495, partial [Deltaproteobacteria bacterium]|nr:hypothetical protein [Deltaproteobacteria bacterium]
CTADSCKAGTCAHDNTTAACDDGDACTESDVCAAGKCTAGKAKSCDDGNGCTADSCKAGTCAHDNTTAACDDGDACTESDVCAAGKCTAGKAKSCDDGNGCTVDSCKLGSCEHASAAEGLACGSDPCVESLCAKGTCASVAKYWSKKLAQGTKGSTLYDVATASDGTLWLVGRAGVSGSPGWLLVLKPDGTVLQNKALATDDALARVAPTGTGAVVSSMAGTAYGLDAAGTSQWDVGVSPTPAFAVVGVGSGGEIYAAGRWPAISVDITNIALTRLTASGGVAWKKQYTDLSPAIANGVLVLGNGHAVLAGVGNTSQGMLMRVDSTGAVLWQKTYAAAPCVLQGPALAQDGGLLAVGACPGTGGTDMVLIRTDASGNLLWSKSFDLGGSEGAVDVVATQDGGAWLAGASGAQPQGWLVRASAAGGKIGETLFKDAAGASQWNAVAMLPSGALIVAGEAVEKGWVARLDTWGQATCADAGTCAAQTAVTCDDGNPCTADWCTAAAGCAHPSLPDGTACGAGKTCSLGGCGP